MEQFNGLNITQPGKSEKLRSLQKLVTEAKKKIESGMWDDPNIISIGVGFKLKNNKILRDAEGDELVCLKFMVSRKLADKKIAGGTEASRRIPPVFEYDNTLIVTDVEERSYGRLHQIMEANATIVGQNARSGERVRKQDVVVPGLSISGVLHESAGTIGAIVYDNKTQQPYLLSNRHVLVGKKGKHGDIVVQPGSGDDANINENKVGRLVRYHLGWEGDCAIASIEGRNFAEHIFGLGTKPVSLGVVDLGDKVIKSGRSSDITEGIVSQIEMTVRVDQGDDVKISSFEIIPVENANNNYSISKQGDSGALWLINDEKKNIAVGMLYAGNDPLMQREYALSCYLDKVLQVLDVHLPSL